MAQQLSEFLKKGHDEDEGEEFAKAFKQQELNLRLGAAADAHGRPSPLPIPLLERIDRLDSMIYSLEDMALPTSPSSNPHKASAPRHHRIPSKQSSSSMLYKPAQSLLEEVQERGTLIERVSSMEMRVSKLDSSMRRILSSRSHGLNDMHHLETAQFDMHKHGHPDLGIVEKQEVRPLEQNKGKLDRNKGLTSNGKALDKPKRSEKKVNKFGKWLKRAFS